MKIGHTLSPRFILGIGAKTIRLRLALILSVIFPIESSYGDDRPVYYLNDMKIQACVTAQNAVRARLKDHGRVSFESCVSDKFEVYLPVNDRDYRVSGYATLVDVTPVPKTRQFMVRINHYPGSYGDWGFEVMGIEIDP